jgi:hypothetical protein
MFKLLTIASLVVSSVCAQSAEVGVHTYSHHFLYSNPMQSKEYQNNVNPGVYYSTDEGYTIGTYYNTQRHQSFYLAKTWALTSDFSVTLGAVSGYYHDVPTCSNPRLIEISNTTNHSTFQYWCDEYQQRERIEPLAAVSYTAYRYENYSAKIVVSAGKQSIVTNLVFARSF